MHFDGKFLNVIAFYLNFPHCAFTKEIVLTEIFQKVVIQKFRKIHSVTLYCAIQYEIHCGKMKNLTGKKIRQINYLVILSVKLLLSRNFFQKKNERRLNFRNLHTVNSVVISVVRLEIFKSLN